MKFVLVIFSLLELVCAVNIQIPAIPVGSPIVNADFLGFAVEYFGIEDLFLTNARLIKPPPALRKTELPRRINYSVLQLLVNLVAVFISFTVPIYHAKSTKVPATIRIGGNSANRIMLEGSNLPPLSNLYFIGTGNVLSDYDFQILDFVADLINVKLIIAVGMPTAEPIYAQQWVDVIKANIKPSNLLAIEVGNEPDHFEKKGWRPVGYSYPTFLAEHDVYSSIITNTLGDVQLMGPSYAYPWTFAGFQAAYIRDRSATTKYMAFHRYGLRGCDRSVTLDDLLNSPGVDEYQWVSELSVLTTSSNTINVWGEGGSASCKGVLGISDVFGSGLWAVDIFFEMAFRGVGLSLISGSPQALYGPIQVDRGILNVRPIFYAMLLFNTAIGGPNSIVYRAAPLLSLRLKEWAAYDTILKTHTIVIVHKDTSAAVPYSITIPGGLQGQKIVMTAPAITSTSGYSIAGLMFDGSLDGMPQGVYDEEIIQPVGEVFSFTAIPGSVTLLRVYTTATTFEPLLKFEKRDWGDQAIQNFAADTNSSERSSSQKSGNVNGLGTPKLPTARSGGRKTFVAISVFFLMTALNFFKFFGW